MQRQPSRRATMLLVAGALGGSILAASGLATRSAGEGDLAAELVARVNGEGIRRDDYERLLTAMATDLRSPLDDAMRRHVLERLIDEELLVQHALDLGLARHDRKVRADLTSGVISSVVSEHEDHEPTDAELAAFYERNREFFIQPGRLRLRQIFFRSSSGAADQATATLARGVAERRRAGESFEQLVALGDPPLAPLPDVALPPAKLREYLGPTVTSTALGLAVGAISDPVRSGSGYHVLELLERTAGAPAALEEIRPQVVAEYRRRGGEEALRAYLRDLRERAEIVRAKGLE